MVKCNWSKKRSSYKDFFFLFFLNKLFTYSNIYELIYLFIKQQLWMSALAVKTISNISLMFKVMTVFGEKFVNSLSETSNMK